MKSVGMELLKDAACGLALLHGFVALAAALIWAMLSYPWAFFGTIFAGVLLKEAVIFGRQFRAARRMWP